MPSFIIIILAVTVLGAIWSKQIHPGSVRSGVKAAVCGLMLVSTAAD